MPIKSIPASVFRADGGTSTAGQQQEGANVANYNLVMRTHEPAATKAGRVVHDFAGMQFQAGTIPGRVPLDYRHEQEIGFADNIKVTEDGLVGVGHVVLDVPKGDPAERVYTMSSAGVPYQVSIDWRGPAHFEDVPEGKSVEVNGRSYDGPLMVARKWTLRGVAMCAQGQDMFTASQLFSESAAVDVTVDAVESEVIPTEVVTEDAPPTLEQLTQQAEATARGTLKKFIEQFGQDGYQYFADGLTLEQAQSAHIAKLQEEIKQMSARLESPVGGMLSPVPTQQQKPKGNLIPLSRSMKHG